MLFLVQLRIFKCDGNYWIVQVYFAVYRKLLDLMCVCGSLNQMIDLSINRFYFYYTK